MSNGPLDDPRLQAVEAALDQGRLEAAQALLTDLDNVALHRQAKSYLTTRLLFQRGRLSVEEVALRMQQVLLIAPDFPEARSLLGRARSGGLSAPPRVADSSDSDRAASSVLPLSAPPEDPALPSPSEAAPPPKPLLPDLRFTPADGTEQAVDGRHVSEAPAPLDIPPFFTQPTLPEGLRRADPPVPPELLDFSAPPIPGSPPAPDTHVEENTENETPTLFSVLTLLDDKRYLDALVLLDSRDDLDSPELVLMRARALVGCKQHDRAREVLERLCQSSSIGPDLRAGCARLLLEAGEPDLALEQAQQARVESPDAPIIVLTTAWALLSVSRRDEDTQKTRAAEALLQELDERGTRPPLATALNAYLLAEKGESKQAIAAANRALELQPNSVEAHIALALGHAQLGRSDDARDAWRKLLEYSQEEALALRPRLARLGATLERGSPSLSPNAAEPTSRRVWNPLEVALVNDERGALWDAWESTCERVVSTHDSRAPGSLGALGLNAAEVLACAPGFCHFGPYDLSLWSLLRLEVAIELVYGKDLPETREREFFFSRSLLAAYIGQSMAHAYAQAWESPLVDLEHATLEIRSKALSPWELVSARLRQGTALAFDELAPLETAHVQHSEWARHVVDRTVPPSPWGPEAWPALHDVSTVGRALSRSVVGLYCERFAETPLDHSLESLPALDSYLTLIAPPHGPKLSQSASLVRAAVLVGAYTGEVLCRLSEAAWEPGSGSEAARYELHLGTLRARPIQQVLSRVRGEITTSVTEYAVGLARGVRASP